MGIGSYESAQYIRELGGSIQVDSELGRGTVLTVLLPCSIWRVVRPAGAGGVMSADNTPPLLIVEDDLALQRRSSGRWTASSA
jgi:hypothetical protein